MIRLEKASFSYDRCKEKAALQGVDLSIAAGEHISLTGANGAGKTTLAMMIKGLLEPTAGRILFNGRDMTSAGINHRIGFLFTNPENQIVASVVEEDIAFGPENQGRNTSDIEAAISGALKVSGIPHLRRGLTHLLSGGEQQRVCIAGIVAMDVECVVFDEAASMLDPAARRDIFSLLRRLNREEGITVIQITHSFEEIMSSERVIVLNDGRIEFDGSSEVLLYEESILDALGLDLNGVTTLMRGLHQAGVATGSDLKDIRKIAGAVCSYRK